MRKILCFAIIFVLLMSTICINLNADTNNSMSIGTFVIHVPVNKTTKVYIEPQMKDFVKDANIEVYEEKKGWLFSDKKYYYISDMYVDKIVGSRQINNDVDSLIFIINELETLAKNYINTIQEKERKNEYVVHDGEYDYKNLVLGYIRAIKSAYDGNQKDYWGFIAGKTPKCFISEINNRDIFGLKFKEYFSQFIKYSDYNKNLYGELNEKYRREQNNYLKLKDSLDNGLNEEIDLIHLFASIDGIYKETGCSYHIGANNMEKDIVSWNGDLQYAALHMKGTDRNILKYPDINYLFENDYLGATKDDIIADIDAMNITKTYIDMEESSISDSLSAYYLLIEKSKNIRFKMFLKTILLEEEDRIVGNRTELERLKMEIYSQFNIFEDKNGNLINIDNYDARTFAGFGIMREGGWFNNTFGELPSTDIRAFVVKSFFDYIVSNMEA